MHHLQYIYGHMLCPSQTNIRAVPVSRGDCACLHVSADCPEVTSDGLRHLGRLSQLKVLRLGDLPTDYLTEAVLESLQGYSGLELLGLGLGDPDSPPETASQR